LKRIARLVMGRRRRLARAPKGAPVRVVVFDFDGTLADTFQAGLEILNALAGEFGYRPLLAEDMEVARDMTTRQLIKFLHIPKRRIASISREGTKRLRGRIGEIQPIAGTPEMVRALHAKGLTLGIITSNTAENVGLFLKNHGIEHFEFVRSSSRLLGKAREIRQAIKQHGFVADEMLFVGDECRDIEAAKRAGIRMAAVTWGYNSRRALVARDPEFLLEQPEELVRMIG
jgi:phosphoglycolate phosphatase